MNDCVNVEVRDALPDLLNGKLSKAERALLQDHIDGCAECREELALLREVRSSGAIAPAIDVSRIASAIPAYAPVTAPSRSRQGDFAWTWKVAAAALVIAAGVLGVGREIPSRQATVATATRDIPAVAATRAVSATPSAEKSEGVASTGKQVAALSVVGLQDLRDSDIEELLTDLDGMEAMPSAEPQSVTSVLDYEGSDQ